MLKSPIRASAVTPTCAGSPLSSADEHDLKAADEESERQQHVTAVPKRLAHRFAGRLLECVNMLPASLDHRGGERRDEDADRSERQQGTVPADLREQHLCQRQQRELPEGACRGRNAQRHAPLLGGKGPAQDARDHAKGDAGEPGPDQHAGRENEHPRRGGMRH